ncbi:epimerase [Mucilaginibacter pallidiroseus]|uniref:Epimerase n=1 Tax=Mucilaginibacter pallidiroseus TaxID=2599295 RepID=A0A563UF34_9SPHI|nr:epimerase [Mucilaginibacter pallidiroseus]TWR29916.1 epimerase [Mucilaginibacter pallidiroseus]
MKVIITGVTGLVGEGVLMTCLQHPEIEEVLIVGRKHYEIDHPKIKEILVPGFFDIGGIAEQMKGYNACFFCAGISSAGMSEADYYHITYELTMHFAKTLLMVNPGATFCFISGAHTDSTEKGRFMWARVKGKTENALARLPFKQTYMFRPGLMKPTAGQRNIRGYYKAIAFLYPLLKYIFPAITLQELGLSMVNAVAKGYPKHILEIADIKKLAAS